MSYEGIANTIRSRFKTLIAEVQSLPIQYDNQDFKIPDNRLWARCNIKFGESRQVSIGGGASGNRFRHVGLLMVQLFQPLDRGDKAALALADGIAGTFRGVTVSGVTFRTPSVQNVGRVNGWWQVNVDCPFCADQIG